MKRICCAIALVIYGVMASIGSFCPVDALKAQDDDCVDLEVVFARGSGAKRYESQEWLVLQEALSDRLEDSGLSYKMEDLDYAAAGTDGVFELLSAYVSAGSAGRFGESVRQGVKNLSSYRKEVTTRCSDTRWLLVGYSQGAKVIAETMKEFKSEEVIYVALLGDPELYLPEGEGLLPPACQGEKLSVYRRNVPDCRTSSGILGQRKPYEEIGFAGKYGLWCNDDDLICGSSHNLFVNSGHLKYANLDLMLEVTEVVEEALSGVEDDEDDQRDWVEKPPLDLSRWKVTTTLPCILFENERLGVVLIWWPGLNNETFKELLTKYNHELDLIENGVAINDNVAAAMEMGIDKALSRGVVPAILASERLDEIAEADERLPMPKGMEVLFGGDKIELGWEVSEEARYVIVMLNDTILGYVLAEQGGIIIEDIEGLGEVARVRIAEMDAEFNLGPWSETEVKLSRDVTSGVAKEVEGTEDDLSEETVESLEEDVALAADEPSFIEEDSLASTNEKPHKVDRWALVGVAVGAMIVIVCLIFGGIVRCRRHKRCGNV